jgi:mannopine transport system permease protein
MTPNNPTGARQWPTAVLAIFVLFFLLLPTIIVVPVSFGSEKYLQFPPKSWSLTWYRAYFADREWMESTLFSVVVAVCSAIVGILITLPATLALARGRVPGGGLLKGLILAPMIIPHIVIAVGLYITFARWGINGTYFGFVAAMSVLCVPYLFLTLSAAVSKLDPSLEMAAANLGAGKFNIFRLVTVPLLLPAIAGGMAFAFIMTLDEAVVANFLSSSKAKPVMKKMFEDIDFDVSPVIAAVSTLILVGSLTLIGLAQLFAKLKGGGKAAMSDGH